MIRLKFLFTALLLLSAPLYGADEEPFSEILEMSLEELFQIDVATLTKAERRIVPSAVTTVSRDDIDAAGARSLNELLEIYVPGLHWIGHSANVSQLGLRGIISDRDDKYLLLVNGRTMNQRTVAGAFMERDLPLLSEIHHIDVIRGPGSATLGLGAVSMVINLVTFDGTNFEGLEGRTRVGLREEFYTQELSYGRRFSEQSGLYLYAGVSDYPGADSDRAPYKFEDPFTSRWGEEVSFSDGSHSVTGDRTQYRDKMAIKLHAHLNLEDFELWMRYTRGGETRVQSRVFLADQASGGLPQGDRATNTPGVVFEPSDAPPASGLGYQQFTVAANYDQRLSDEWSVEYGLSYDMTDYERVISVLYFDPDRGWPGDLVQSHREDEYLGQILFHYEPLHDGYSAAFGLSLSHEEFGLNSPGFPDEPATASGYRIDNILGDPLPRWSTRTYSMLFEHQWRFHDNWTSFLGGRIDKNSYSDALFSPRVALIHAPTNEDILKLIYSRSQRMNFAAELRDVYEDFGVRDSDPERLDTLELRWEHDAERWSSGVSLFYQELEAIGFNSALSRSSVVAEQEQWGIELEARYQQGALTATLSHAYTDLIDFDLRDDASSIISAGDDLNNWSSHQSKLALGYAFTPQWRGNAFAQYYWGFPGIDEMVSEGGGRSRRIDEESAYLHLSLEYAPTQDLSARLTGHYLLGVFDEDLNKRHTLVEGPNNNAYRAQSPALSLELDYRF